MSFAGKKIAVSLCPGGLPGIEAHVGAWMAMEAAGIIPQQLCGCSAGAIVAAVWANGADSAVNFGRYVQGLKTSDLIKKRFMWKERIFWIDHFCDPAPLEAQIAKILPESFNDLRIPLTVTATSMDHCPEKAVRFSTGNRLRQAVRASSSIAGVWPYADIDGFPYTDGGTSNAVVMPDQINDWDLVLVIRPCRTYSFQDRDRNMISRLLWNVEQLQDFEPEQAAELHETWPCIKWLDLNIGEVSCLEFSHDHDLIDRAFYKTQSWLQEIEKGIAS